MDKTSIEGTGFFIALDALDHELECNGTQTEWVKELTALQEAISTDMEE